ncbi:AAA family ATPase [Helicobacter valdiviensis]|uniref:AAA family ATPase n=1 Tax=Helicobacter valdiviensis TaxID=1458358 RepID=A0A2W6NJI9_9HELI|nr:AAA family ATPase [Helicobacter valdiviensis]PZT47546.1 AAA family ATPase [Helicobacter valdiviensis]
MQKSRILIFAFLAFFLAILLFFVFISKDKSELISSTQLQNLMQNTLPQNAKIKGDYLYFNLENTSYKIAKDSLDLQEFGKKVPISIAKENNNLSLFIFGGIFLVIILLLFLQKKPSKQSLTNSQNTLQSQAAKDYANAAFDLYRIKPMISNLSFEDVAGISEAKTELEEIIDYLKDPKKYQDFGLKLPKGVLLIGPPGVGKTLIAKAVAGEAKVPFFYQSGASFVQIYVGMGAKKVSDLFTKAKLNAPSIIFIDEIDAVGKARGGGRNDEREATLNQLLTEMDGFEDSNGVIVIGATNNIESMDEALLRSGRFDRRVYVELPNLQERIKILKVHSRNKTCDFDYEEVARHCVGFSGADLAALLNEAGLLALKRHSKIITKEDVLNVKNKIVLGTKKKLNLEDKEKEILAYYKAAKAFANYYFGFSFDKVSLSNEDNKQNTKELASKNELTNQLKVLLSGIAALELLYNEKYTYSKEDLKEAKNLAQKMIENYGMGEFLIGKQEDCVLLLEECKKQMFDFFKNYQKQLKAIALKLLEEEKIDYKEIENIASRQFI